MPFPASERIQDRSREIALDRNRPSSSSRKLGRWISGEWMDDAAPAWYRQENHVGSKGWTSTIPVTDGHDEINRTGKRLGRDTEVDMLVLSRKSMQSVTIGSDIRITVI